MWQNFEILGKKSTQYYLNTMFIHIYCGHAAILYSFTNLFIKITFKPYPARICMYAYNIVLENDVVSFARSSHQAVKHYTEEMV